MTALPAIAGIGSSIHGVNGNISALDAVLAKLVASGCTHAELSPSHMFVTLGGRDNEARIARIAAICARHDLAYTLHAPVAVNFMEEVHAELHQAVLRSVLSFGARIGASLAVIHPGRVHPHADRAARQHLLAVERDQMLRAADMAGRLGLAIGMENLAPNGAMGSGKAWSYALDPRALAEQIASIDHPAVCGTLDFGHGWVSASMLGFDYADAVRSFAPFVGHLHITDNFGVPATYDQVDGLEIVAYGMGDLHLPIGWGSVPYETILPGLPIRPGSRATIELKPHFSDELANSVTATEGLFGL